MSEFIKEFMREAIKLSHYNVEAGTGGPFAAVIVKDGRIIAKMSNRVTSANDPTAHAEIEAIRQACKSLNTFDLSGCEIYTTCEPCPMCLSAIYWARLDKIYFANTKVHAAEIGFDDAFIYSEFDLPIHKRKIPMIQLLQEEAIEAFERWKAKEDKTHY